MKALLVIDMQNDFITGPLGTKETQRILPRVVEKVRAFDGRVFTTMDTHNASYLSTQEGRLLPVEHCLEGSEGWKIPEELFQALLEKDAEPEKKRGFGAVRTVMKLMAWQAGAPKISEVVLVGVCTDICVLSTAILAKSHMPEVKITVDASCCAGTSPEAHETALKAMRQCQIQIENWESDGSF